MSFSPGIGKHFIGNTLCTSDDSVAEFIYVLHIVMISRVFYKCPEKKSKQVKSGNKRAREWVLILSNDQETLCTERQNTVGEVRWCTI
jgi:hypothetical protein